VGTRTQKTKGDERRARYNIIKDRMKELSGLRDRKKESLGGGSISLQGAHVREDHRLLSTSILHRIPGAEQPLKGAALFWDGEKQKTTDLEIKVENRTEVSEGVEGGQGRVQGELTKWRATGKRVAGSGFPGCVKPLGERLHAGGQKEN